VPSNNSGFILEEEVGPISIRVEGGQCPLIWLRTPPIHEGGCFDAALCAKALGLEQHDLLPLKPQLLSAGNPTLLIAAKDKAAIDRASLDLAGLRSLNSAENEPFCVFLFAPAPEGAYSRMFAPDFGVPEDPATGSSTGPLACFMMRHDLVPKIDGTRFVSEQGTKMGRRSILHVEIHGENGSDGIYVGGHVTPIIEGVMSLNSW
jgi:trans-2,3-dihydro-3-hydroxyanthranilate isomerase